MAWCHLEQAITSTNVDQYVLMLYGVTRPQWVKGYKYTSLNCGMVINLERATVKCDW